MTKNSTFFWIILLLCLGRLPLNAQETITTAGGEGIGDGGIVSYTVGQTFYIANSSATGSVAPGVQQPYEISEVTGVSNLPGMNLSCTVYPNPTTAYLQVKLIGSNDEKLQYSLFDEGGKLMASQYIEGMEASIDIQQYKPAVYFLLIEKSQKEPITLKTFKIIKNQ